MAVRQINAAGRELIISFEGYRTRVYKDPVGYPTVGVGHLLTAAEREHWPVGTKLSPSIIDALFTTDLVSSEAAVSRLAAVRLSDNEFAALVSFTFNLGAGALGRSTLLKKLNAGEYTAAADEFLKWTKAGKPLKELPGLVRRRKAERKLFLTIRS